jgi:hypothetical protein
VLIPGHVRHHHPDWATPSVNSETVRAVLVSVVSLTAKDPARTGVVGFPERTRTTIRGHVRHCFDIGVSRRPASMVLEREIQRPDAVDRSRIGCDLSELGADIGMTDLTER